MMGNSSSNNSEDHSHRIQNVPDDHFFSDSQYPSAGRHLPRRPRRRKPPEQSDYIRTPENLRQICIASAVKYLLTVYLLSNLICPITDHTMLSLPPTLIIGVSASPVPTSGDGQEPQQQQPPQTARQPYFAEPLDGDNSVHRVAVGRSIRFRCAVNDIGSYKVSWFQKDKRLLLAIDNRTVAWRERIQVSSQANSVFFLQIDNVQLSDKVSVLWTKEFRS